MTQPQKHNPKKKCNATLFHHGEFELHSGEKSLFKIDCDSLNEHDYITLAGIIANRFKFNRVFGIPRGGVGLSDALKPYAELKHEPNTLLIVDDVFTTGGSIHTTRDLFKSKYDNIIGIVIFARGECPDWVHPIFSLNNNMF